MTSGQWFDDVARVSIVSEVVERLPITDALTIVSVDLGAVCAVVAQR